MLTGVPLLRQESGNELVLVMKLAELALASWWNRIASFEGRLSLSISNESLGFDAQICFYGIQEIFRAAQHVGRCSMT